MNIVDFILNNWFIVVILYVVLSTFLKRGKGGGSAKQRRPGRVPNKGGMPPFGGGGGPSGWPGQQGGDHEPTMTQAAPAQAPAKPAPVAKTQAAAPASSALAVKPAPTALASARGDMRQGLPSRQEPAAAQGEAATALSVSPQDARRGVVWAEILGPPRAKRPYRYK